MNRLFINMLIILFMNSYIIHCQVVNDVNKWKEYIEDLAEETDDENRLETLYSELSYLTEHPMDLNQVTREQLTVLPFLSDHQIENIIHHREKYGYFVSLYELKNVDLMDLETIMLLLPFVHISDISVNKYDFTVKNMLKYGNNELLIRYDQCLQPKKGYCSYPDSLLEHSPNKKYLGEPFYHSLRYSYSFDDRFMVGFVAEKDAGEPFWNKYHKGYDYYSAHLLLKDMGKVLKTLVIGDYKASFGQGLVVSNDFVPSKSALVTQFDRRNNGFRRHYSTNEIDFFRGTAFTLGFRNWRWHVLASYRKMDAFKEEHSIRSFKTDGYHRLKGDLEKKRNVPMWTLGSHLRYDRPSFSVGLTLLSYSFGNYRMDPSLQPYNYYFFRGKRNLNASVDYLFKNRCLKFYGETALSRNGALATLNALQLTPVSYFSLVVLHRYYDKRYHAFYGHSFAQNSKVQNENGIYIGMQWSPFPYWKLTGYADFFKFPWLKYGVDAPSEGREYMFQTTYQKNDRFSIYVRYRQRINEKNYADESITNKVIEESQQHSLKIQSSYSLSSAWLMRTTIEGKLNGWNRHHLDKGILVAQNITFQPSQLPLKMDLYWGYFHTDGYGTRVYSNEKNILYAFSCPSFYGRGYRFTFSFRWDLINKLSLFGKIGHTLYTDRDKIGTNLEEITGKNKTDMYLQLRWKF